MVVCGDKLFQGHVFVGEGINMVIVGILKIVRLDIPCFLKWSDKLHQWLVLLLIGGKDASKSIWFN